MTPAGWLWSSLAAWLAIDLTLTTWWARHRSREKQLATVTIPTQRRKEDTP